MLIDLFDRRMLRPTLLVGHSMGSEIATEIARRRPDLARTLVLIGPVVNDRRPTAWHQGVDLARDTLLEPLDGNAIVVADYLRAGPRWYAMELKEMLAYPLRDRLAGVAVPVLVLRGEHDPVGRADWCKRLLTSNSRATLVHIRRGRHLVQHSRAGACADAVRWHESAHDRDRKPIG
jgi:pimeloyl-ACP methyl ester carboxylesterase